MVRDPAGVYVVTYQSDPGGTTPRASRRACSTGRPRPGTWSPPHPLAPTLAPSADDRMIDGALVFTGISSCSASSTRRAPSPRSSRSPGRRPACRRAPGSWWAGPTSRWCGGTIENYEFVMAPGHWRLVATSNNLDQPWMFTLAGNPATVTGWLRWTRRVRPRHPLRAVQRRARHLEHRVRARQFGLPLRCQLAPEPLLLPLYAGVTSSPNSAAGAMPPSVWPGAPTWSTGRCRPVDTGRRSRPSQAAGHGPEVRAG